MSRFKPQVSYITRDSCEVYFNASPYKKVSQTITKQFNTYKELKKELPEICEKNIDADGVSVVRSKRGQWGEWFERWENVNGVPTIIKEGWS